MVTITNGQTVAENENLRVYSPDGDYADIDLILCSDVKDLSFPVSMYQSQFVKYGSIVYQFSTPEDLGKAVLAIDPDSTLDAVALYKEQAARDAARAAGTLTPDNPVPAPDSPDPNATTTDATSTPQTDDIPSVDTPVQDAATSTSDTPPPSSNVSTTTPDTASSTPDQSAPYDPSNFGETLTAPPEDLSTTTSTTTDATTTSLDVASSTSDVIASSTPDLSTTTPE